MTRFVEESEERERERSENYPGRALWVSSLDSSLFWTFIFVSVPSFPVDGPCDGSVQFFPVECSEAASEECYAYGSKQA